MKHSLLLVVFLQLFLFLPISFGQNLFNNQVWDIPSSKKSIYLDKGIFHHKKNSMGYTLTNVRSSYSAQKGYERIVLDFDKNDIAGVYGHISSTKQKIYIDLFQTGLKPGVNQTRPGKLLKNIDFFSLDKDHVSLEFSFNDKISADVFYLENPGRLVIDVKTTR